MRPPTNNEEDGDMTVQKISSNSVSITVQKISSNADKELKYQCRCSFLEIYNEQITDLLDPNQRKIQRNVFLLWSMKDVKHLLLQGGVNVVMGNASDIGEALLASPHSVSLELGGNAPCIIFDDADLDIDVRGIVIKLHGVLY
nr:kinesin-like protein KIN12B isoform X2 [Ipomoea batatas]